MLLKGEIHLKKFLTFIVLALFSVIFCGCYPTGDKRINEDDISNYVGNIESQDSISSEELTSFPETSDKIEVELKNVKVSFTMPNYNVNSINQINVKMKEWDEDTLKNIFFYDEQDLSYSEYENRYDNIKCHSYKTEDERFLSYEPGFITYYNLQKRRDYSYPLISSSIFLIDMQDTFNFVEFDDFSVAQAQNTVESYLNKLEIDNLSTPIVYSITANDANKYFDSYGEITDKHGNPIKKWTEQQQCYILIYPFEYNDIEFSIARENYILAIITKDVLIELSCNNLISSSTVEGQNADIRYDAEKALNMIIDKYEKIIIDNPIHIIDCKLSYIKKENSSSLLQKYIPVWEFTLKTEYDDIGTRISQNYIDVQSGEIF